MINNILDGNADEKPTITVAMPVYNGEKYLAEAIDSILSQTYINFEFVIIDDGSTDGSLKIIREYQKRDGRIRLITRENRGLPATLNEIIDLARGRWIARMDQDDISLPNRFEKQLQCLVDNKADICGCHWLVINPEGTIIDANIMPLNWDSFTAYLSYTVPFAHGSVMMRKDFLIDNSLKYDFIKYAEDYDLWIRMFEASAIFTNVDEFLFKYRDAPSTLSKVVSKENYIDTKMLHRKFILSNAEACLSAVRSLSIKYTNLPTIEKIYVLYLSYHISGLFKSPYFRKILKNSSLKIKIFALMRILKG